METIKLRFCLNCSTMAKLGLEQPLNYTCPTCDTSYQVKGSFLISEDNEIKSSFLDRSLQLQRGERTTFQSGQVIQKTYSRFQTEKNEFEESPMSEIMNEGIQLWLDSLGKLVLIVLFFGLLLFLVNLVNNGVIETNQAISEFFGIDLSPNWITIPDLIFSMIPIMLIPILNPLNWFFYIVQTLGLGLATLVMWKVIYSSPTKPIPNSEVIKLWLRNFHRLIALGTIISIINLFLFDNGKFFVEIFGDGLNIFNTGFDNIQFQFFAWAISVFVLFPIWMLSQIILFLSIPSAVLSKQGRYFGVEHSEVLVRGRYQKTFKFLVARIIILFIPLIIFRVLETIIIDEFFSNSTISILNTTISPGGMSGFLFIPLIFVSLTLMSAWQLILYEEENRRWLSLRQFDQTKEEK